MSYEELDLDSWVASAPAQQRTFREAVHIVLHAISTSTALSSTMVMKGGLLMAIRYKSTRYTKDADFSTTSKYEKGEAQQLLKELDSQLDEANEKLEYDTMCLRQRAEIRPLRPDAQYPTLSLSIGYAQRSQKSEINRLRRRQSPTVVQIDYSYNEAVFDVEVLHIGDEHGIHAYSLLNLLAEKYRSLLQQPIRKRNRRQDVYDINLLLLSLGIEQTEKQKLVELIIATCAERQISADKSSISNDKVIEMARAGYDELAPEVEAPLEPFDQAFSRVRDFYETLPWPEAKT